MIISAGHVLVDKLVFCTDTAGGHVVTLSFLACSGKNVLVTNHVLRTTVLIWMVIE